MWQKIKRNKASFISGILVIISILILAVVIYLINTDNSFRYTVSFYENKAAAGTLFAPELPNNHGLWGGIENFCATATAAAAIYISKIFGY